MSIEQRKCVCMDRPKWRRAARLTRVANVDSFSAILRPYAQKVEAAIYCNREKLLQEYFEDFA